MTPVGIIERAYQLAGQSGSVEEIRRKLANEGYFNVHAHLGGRQIRSDLSKRLDPTRTKLPGEPEVSPRQQSPGKS